MSSHTPDPTIDPVTRYVAALRATSGLEQPYGAALFVLLTTMVRPHELLRPTTNVLAGQLVVEVGRGPSAARTVPLDEVTLRLLRNRTGVLAECLGIPSHALPRFGSRLRMVLTDHEGVAGLTTPEQATALALGALTAVARTPGERAAVFMYAGITAAYPGVKRAATSGPVVVLEPVLELVDQLTAKAGFVDASTEVLAPTG